MEQCLDQAVADVVVRRLEVGEAQEHRVSSLPHQRVPEVGQGINPHQRAQHGKPEHEPGKERVAEQAGERQPHHRVLEKEPVQSLKAQRQPHVQHDGKQCGKQIHRPVDLRRNNRVRKDVGNMLSRVLMANLGLLRNIPQIRNTLSLIGMLLNQRSILQRAKC